MKIKIMLLAIGAALLLTACGQVERSSTETTLPPTPAAQEDAQQPQATPEPATAAQEMDTVPITAQEQPQKRILIRRKALRKLSPLSRSRNVYLRRIFHQKSSTPRRDMWSRNQRQNLNLNQPPRHRYLRTVKPPSTPPTPMRPHNTVSPRTQVWHWITALTASQPQYRWMPRRKHWKPRRETW